MHPHFFPWGCIAPTFPGEKFIYLQEFSCLVSKSPQNRSQSTKFCKIFWGGMPPDPPTERARTLRLRDSLPPHFLLPSYPSALGSAHNRCQHEFFPPRQHIFMHSAHTTFVGTPLPQHSLLSGQTWWGPHTWRDLSGNTVNDIHDRPQAQQSEVKGRCQPDFRPAFP